jgi:Leucine-rich repeat (LRR) protein
VNALLKLISTNNVKNAIKLCKRKKLMFVNKKHQFVLTDVLDVGYMYISKPEYSNFNMVYGEKFARAWGLATYKKTTKMVFEGAGAVQWDRVEINGSGDPKGQPFTGLKVFFSDQKSPRAMPGQSKPKTWSKPLSDMKGEVMACGGEIVNSVDDADIVVTLNEDVQITVGADVVVSPQAEFILSLPSTEAANKGIPVKKMTGDAASLWKLLSTRDLSSIQQGLELIAAIPEQIDILLDGCSINDDGEIVRSKRFMVSGPAMTYLDLALYGLISSADTSSPFALSLRKSIKKIDQQLSGMPILKGFDNLESITIRFTSDVKMEDLTCFGTFPKLNYLKLVTHNWSSKFELVSLMGLDAPNLEEIEIDDLKLQDINPLINCKKLKKVTMTQNQIKSLEGLVGSAETLEEINFYNSGSFTSVLPLAQCKKLRWLNIGFPNDPKDVLNNLEGLESFKLEKDTSLTIEFSIKQTISLGDLIKINLRKDVNAVELQRLDISESWN